jgi:hypothetical protein
MPVGTVEGIRRVLFLMRPRLLLPLIPLALLPPLAAQAPVALEQERAAYAQWLAAAPNSPYRAVAQQPIGPGIRIAPDGDLPLEGVPAQRVTQKGGTVELEGAGASRLLPRHRPVTLGRYTVVAGGTPGRAVLMVFDPARIPGAPEYFPPDPSLVFLGPLLPAASPRTERLLAPDGVEVEATEAGAVVVDVGGVATRLKVMRIPDPATGESELEIFFRDSTNAAGTYPAGRFVALTPAGEGRYRLDFNRARNPFCAYSSAYACPAPWRGNALPLRIEAGEKYHPTR